MAASESSPISNTSSSDAMEAVKSALQVGSACGMSGILVGGVAGVLRSTTPTLFALASGIQCFVLGSTYWGSRSVLLQNGQKEVSPQERITASAIAGSVAGGAGGMLRGRGNIIPGIIVLALSGAAGQKLFNIADARHTRQIETNTPNNTSWTNSKWSPMKVLSDADYEKILQEKLLQVNAEIALLDERAESLREKQQHDLKAADGGKK